MQKDICSNKHYDINSMNLLQNKIEARCMIYEQLPMLAVVMYKAETKGE
jgi:hypothetical protein